jgi:hypothetical protein
VAVRRWGRTLAAPAAAVLAMTLGGCSPGGSTTDPAQPGRNGGTPSVQSSTPARPAVTFPWTPGRPQLGMHVYWVDNPKDSDEVIRAKTRRLVDYVTKLDVNSIALSFPIYTDGPRASAVRAAAGTPTPDRVASVLEEFRRSGMRTTLRPLLDERSLQAVDPKGWRGDIRPSSRDRWFASYGQLIVPYLRVAQTMGTKTFVIGAELNSLEGDPHWQTLVAHARQAFHREIGYSLNWDSYISRPLRVSVDRVGVDAYFPIDADDDAPVGALVKGWQRWLDQRSTGPMPRTVFDEVGAPAENGGYRHPGVWGTAGHPLNLLVQQRWFAAACQVARARKIAGLYWWKLDFHTDPAAADPTGDHHDSFVGRPAERTIKTCFTAWGAAT